MSRVNRIVPKRALKCNQLDKKINQRKNDRKI